MLLKFKAHVSLITLSECIYFETEWSLETRQPMAHLLTLNSFLERELSLCSRPPGHVLNGSLMILRYNKWKRLKDSFVFKPQISNLESIQICKL